MSLSETVQLTQQLVKIASENPNGSERECANFIKNWLNEIDGIEITLQQVEEDRENIIISYKSTKEDKLAPIIILAHMDTVPIEGDWKHDPLGATIVDGKMYGRGATDMKSGLACALMTIKEIASAQIRLKRDLYVIATVDEEGPYMKGANAIVDGGFLPENGLLIATEPTELTLSTVHKGVIWYEVIMKGKSAHGGNAHLGADAAHAAAEMIARVKDRVEKLPYDHHLFGKSRISVGKITGGHKTNMVTGSCRIELDFRLVPPMTNEEANEIIETAAKEACERVQGTSASISHFGYERPPLETEETCELIPLFKETYKEVLGDELEFSGFPAYTDVSMIALRTDNRNCVVFGPGRLTEAHAVNEYVEVAQIDKCKDVLVQLVQK